MEYAIFGILVLVGVGFLGYKRFKKLEKNKERKRQEELERVREEERRKSEEERKRKEEEAKRNDPCRDMRDGSNYSAYMTPSECNKHGYFWCPIAKRCMPSSVNVNNCGKPTHLM
jgi:hypothetical protein